jgi:hypothetical protein
VREWERREERGKEEKTVEQNRREWKRSEQNGRGDLCNKYGCLTVCALDTSQSSLHVLVTVCAATADVPQI